MRSAEVRALLALAREDLAVAEAIAARHGRPAAFHLQQAAEKLVKAVLALEGVAFPRSHDLGALAASLPAGHPWRADLAALDGLTAFATGLRYPTADGDLPPEPDAASLAGAAGRLAALVAAVGGWCERRLTSG